MNKIALSLTINKYVNYFESISHFLIFDTLENTKSELINILVTHYKKLHINYPHDLTDFEYELFSQNYVKADAFVYKIYYNERWEEPWESQDIYDEVIEKIIKEADLKIKIHLYLGGDIPSYYKKIAQSTTVLLNRLQK